MRYFYILFFIFCRKLPFIKNRNLKIISGILKGYKWSTTADNTYLLGIYEENMLNMLEKHLKKNDIVYDIGANTGYVTLAAAKLTGEKGVVYAFEPIASNIKQLKKHLNINNINNCEVLEYAVSDKIGKLFFSNNSNTVANTYISESSVFIHSSKIEVNTVSLDYLTKNKIILPPHLMKIDVEGAEYDVLLGASNLIELYKPIILFATHNNHKKNVKEKCCNLLAEMNYTIQSIFQNREGEMEDFIAIYKKV